MVYGGQTGPWSPCSVVDSEFHRQVVRKEQLQEEKWATANAVRDALLQSGSAATLDALSEAKLRREGLSRDASRGSLMNRSAKSTPSFASLTRGWSGHVPRASRYATSPNHRQPPRPASAQYLHPPSSSYPPTSHLEARRPRTPPPYRPPPSGPGEHRYYAAAEPTIPPWRSSSRSPARARASPVPMGPGERMQSPASRASFSSQSSSIGPETARWRSTLSRSPSLVPPAKSPGHNLPPPKLFSPPSHGSPPALISRYAGPFSPSFVRPKPRRSTRGILLAAPPGGVTPAPPRATPFTQGMMNFELGSPPPRRPASAMGGFVHLSEVVSSSSERSPASLVRAAPFLYAPEEEEEE